MSIYKFRILIEAKDDIFRDIEIKSTQNFEEFHQIILKSFNFDNKQMASFYTSDEDWNKGQEIALFDMNITEDENEQVLIMNQTLIHDKATSIGQHLLYTYDFLNMWNFYIELIEITVKEPNKTYPLISYKQGEAPLQSSKNSVLSNEELANELLANDNDLSDETFEDDIFEGFDDFDNYQ